MIPTGPTPVRSLPVRKGPRGVRQVEISPGRWMDEAVAIAQGIPLTHPLPTNGAGPVVRRHEAPEVPSVPTPARTAARQPVKEPQRSTAGPSERQLRAWEAYHRHGGQAAAGRALGWSQGNVRSALVGYMVAREMAGPVPPPDPSLFGGPTVLVEPAEVVVDARPLGALVGVADPGADHAPDIPETIPDADPGHEMTASTGGEPGDGGRAVEGTPAPPHPEPPLLEDPPSSDQAPAPVDAAASIARLARERDEMEMARDELREMLDDAIERADQRPGRDRYLDALLSGLSTHPTDNIRDRIERVLGFEVDRDAWADGYRRALGDVLDVIRGTRGTAYPHQDIIERIARLAIDVPLPS